MILLSCGLVAVAVADLIRWSPVRVAATRAFLGIAGGTCSVATLAALSGSSLALTAGLTLGTLILLALWVGFDYGPIKNKSQLQLAFLAALLCALFAFSGTVDPIGGFLRRWYEDLGFGFVGLVSVDQFVLGVSSGLFLTASANRVVRLVLDAAAIRWDKGEAVLAGGRVLGPLERLIVAAIVLAADPAAAAIVITAKGLLRFPEIRSENQRPGPDEVTEYFLIGTFTSLFLAALFAVLVLAAG